MASNLTVHVCVTVKAIIVQLQLICAIACFAPTVVALLRLIPRRDVVVTQAIPQNVKNNFFQELFFIYYFRSI